jgi:exopolysaccharide biosynthesis protein
MTDRKIRLASVFLALTTQLACVFPIAQVDAQGPIPMPAAPVHVQRFNARGSRAVPVGKRVQHRYPGSVKIQTGRRGKNKRAKRVAPPPPPPQNLVGNLSGRTLAPGVTHKLHRGSMFINVLDVDLSRANIIVKPILAGESFNRLDEVKDQAQRVQAIAAVNGNYFKKDGTPLGTLIIDGEWIAGPIFDRTCLGITRDGRVLVDRVNLHGTLTTSNAEAPTLWVNNINQPRRSGAHVIAYTRRWGDAVKMQYEGTLVAVDAQGDVVGKDGWYMAIPPGGYVLSDSKESDIAKLNVGDRASLKWTAGPSGWSDVVNAVSGGPVLIRDGKLYVGCKDERFAAAWTTNKIHARTAVGVTANRHLLLATIEGPHTLWDVAKFLKKLGAVDAMNLDGGGSTTMVIGSQTVTKNSNKFQRRVASSLAILPRTAGNEVVQYKGNERVVNAPAIAPAVVPAVVPTIAPSVVQRTVPMLPILPAMPMSAQQQQPHAPVVAGSGNNAEIDASGASQKGSRFGWMKRLNPLRD